jgi:hypothetical protein
MENNGALYHSIDIQVTLRCNAACKNCIKGCSARDVTGLELSGMDMTYEILAAFVLDVQNIGGKVFDIVCVTGGEPLLHRKIETILSILELNVLAKGHCNRLIINSNQILPAPPALARYMANGTKPSDTWRVHNCAYLHPDEMKQPRPTYAGCTHYRKHGLVLNAHGYSVCCAADGYIRLFRLQKELIVSRLPARLEDFPLAKMDLVCQHCPFGCAVEVFERDRGRPVSEIYKREGAINAKFS